jgi:hypothetical protein
MFEVVFKLFGCLIAGLIAFVDTDNMPILLIKNLTVESLTSLL